MSSGLKYKESTVPTDPPVAVDAVGGLNYQQVKLVNPATGSAADLSATVPIPVRLTDGTAFLSALPITSADGTNVTLGTTTDAAEISDSPGTVTGFLRGLVKWAYERMPAALGQTTMAASVPVTIASNQTSLPLAGDVAHDAPDSGNPVKVGGIAGSAAPTAVAALDRVNTWHSLTGRPMVGLVAGNANVTGAGTPSGVAEAGGETPKILAVAGWLKEANTSSWDAQEANGSRVELASASRTTTQTGGDRTNYSLRALHVVIDVTVAGTGSITPSIQGKDPNGVYYDLLVGTAITSNGTTVLKVGPGLTPVANGVANDYLPRTFRVNITANNANAITYSVGYNLMGS